MARRIEVEIVGNASSLNRAFNSSRKNAGLWNSEIVRSGRGAFAATVGFGGLGRAVAFASAQFIAFASIATIIKNTTAATVEFNDTMQKTVGLAQVSQQAIAGLSDELLDLAPKVGKTPNELAKALYFVASAGISASNAMKVVQVSAEAASAGLGDTQTVADALTSAINAYGQANLSAKKAADVFVATVRLGKGEADAFAPSLGNVANVAAALGVSFQDLGGALASITRLGVEPQTAAIELQQAFASLLKVTPQARDAFHSVGLTLKGLKETLAGPTGLAGFLAQLKSHFKGNTDALAQAFPNMRAFRGILALIGAQSADVNKVLQTMQHTGNSLKTAFGAIAHDSAFRFDQLKAAVQSLGITIGDIFAPLATSIAVSLTGAAERFREFINKVEKQDTITAKINVVVVGTEQLVTNLLKRLAGVIGGPEFGSNIEALFNAIFEKINTGVKRLYATLRSNFGKIRETLVSLAQALEGISKPFFQLGGAAVVAAFKALQAVLPPVLSALKGIADALNTRVGRAFAVAAIGALIAVRTYAKLIIVFTTIKTAIVGLISFFRGLAVVIRVSAAAGLAFSGLNPILIGITAAVGAAAFAYSLFAHQSNEVADANRRVADAVHAASRSVRDLRGALLDLKGAHLAVKQAQLTALVTRKELTRVENDPHASPEERKQALLTYKQALLEVKRAQNDLINAEVDAASARGGAKKTVEGMVTAFGDLSGKTNAAVDDLKRVRRELQDTRFSGSLPPNALKTSTDRVKAYRDSLISQAKAAQAFANANRAAQPAFAKIAQTIANQAIAKERLLSNLLGIPDGMEALKPKVRKAAKDLAAAIGGGLKAEDAQAEFLTRLAELPGKIKKITPAAVAAAAELGGGIGAAIVAAVTNSLANLQQAVRDALKKARDKTKTDTGGGGKGGGDTSFDTSKSFELPFKLQLAEARAALTKTMKDDIAAWKAEIAFIKSQIPHLHGKKLLEALQALKQIQDNITNAIKDGQQAVNDTFVVPLKIQLAQAKAQALGDNDALRKALIAARAAAQRALRSGKLSIQAQIDAWNTIADINQQLMNDITNAYGKFKKASLRAETAGLGLTDEQRRILELRLSQIGPGGTVPSVGTGAGGFIIDPNTGRPIKIKGVPRTQVGGGGGAAPATPTINETIKIYLNIDGKKITEVVTRRQQHYRRSNPQSRRGPHAATGTS